MADVTLTTGAPGIASYTSETYGNVKELRLQDNPAMVTKNVTITASGADLDLALFSVVDAAGLAAYEAAVADKTAMGVLLAPVQITDGDSVVVPIAVAGYFDYDVLVFASTFDTDAKKKAAFDGLGAPINILLDTNAYDSDGVLA